MTTSHRALAEQFSELESEELVRRLQSGQLTDTAGAIARAELDRRGMHVPPAAEGDAEEEMLESGGDMVTLDTFDKPTEAHILVARLQAEGIHAIVADANLGQAQPFLRFAAGGVRVLVAATQLSRARSLMDAIRNGELAIGDGEEDEPPKPPACPACSGKRVRLRQAGVFRSLVLWNDAPRWHCEDCGNAWASSI
jgi:hypothetical protein